MTAIIGYPFGWVMWLLYQLVDNYLLALILFTLITKLILIPISVKQQKNSAKMSLFQPKLEALKKKYGNNQQKYQEEMQKLYEQEGLNPASSCFPMLIQMLLILGIYDVVNKPLSYILRMPKDTIKAFINTAKSLGCSFKNGTNGLQAEIQAFNFFKQDPSKFADILDSQTMEAFENFKIEFFGINFGEIPTWVWPIMLIPILSGLTALISSIISMAVNKKNNPAMANQGASMGVMMLMAPIMSLWIAFAVPAGVGFYWTISNIFLIFQTIIIGKIYTPEKLKELAEKEIEKNKSKRAIYTTATVVDKKTGEEKTVIKENMTDAERIAAARKRMEEKYGDD